MGVRRIFVEKKPAYAVKAGELREELESGFEGKGERRVLQGELWFEGERSIKSTVGKYMG